MFQKKIVIALFLLTICFLFTGCIVGSVNYEQSTKEVEKFIKENQMYREIDGLCVSFPLPEDFKLLGKSGLFKIKGISYNYDSKYKFDQIEMFFKDYFKNNGWGFSEPNTLTRGLEFTNEDYRVRIFPRDQSGYSINCFKKLDINK